MVTVTMSIVLTIIMRIISPLNGKIIERYMCYGLTIFPNNFGNMKNYYIKSAH